MLLSIIIPVYNVEKYIGGTLSSIYDQNFNESKYEVIVVNDGSPDNSMEIVERFVRQHSNITVIDQVNQGLSCARNAGLKIARGDYIWFVDSDDCIAPDSLSGLSAFIEKSNDVDFWCFDIMKIFEKNSSSLKEKFFLSKNKIGPRMVSKLDFGIKTHMAPAQRFIFRRSFLEKNELRFYPGIIHEDDEFMIRCALVAEKICYEPYSPYLYLIRNGGNIMSSVSMNSLMSKMKIIESLEYIAKNNSLCVMDYYFLSIHRFDQMNSILHKACCVDGGVEFVRARKHAFTQIAMSCMRSCYQIKKFKKMLKSFLVGIRLKMY